MRRLVSAKWLAVLVVLALMSSVMVACCGDRSSVKSPADGITTTTRQLLMDTNPTAAPGKDQQLIRVIIPAGATLAPHTHAGGILSIITEGTLTYTVYRDGTAIIMRNAASAHPTKEDIKPGETKTINTGDALYEPQGIVHSGKNEGKEPIVIYQSALMDDGAPPSSPATP